MAWEQGHYHLVARTPNTPGETRIRVAGERTWQHGRGRAPAHHPWQGLRSRLSRADDRTLHWHAVRDRNVVAYRAAHCRPIPAEAARILAHGGSPASRWSTAHGDTDHPVVGVDQWTDGLVAIRPVRLSVWTTEV